AQWVAHIRVNPRVAFHVADDLHAHHTRVQVQAHARILEGPIAPTASPTLLGLPPPLSRRYLGPDGPRYAEHTIRRPRVLVRLEPVRWGRWAGGGGDPRHPGAGATAGRSPRRASSTCP